MCMNALIRILVAFLVTSFMSLPVVSCPKVVVRTGDDYVAVFGRANTQYIIRENLDLEGSTIRIGRGSTLVFQGGSLANGVVVGDGTRIKARDYTIFKSGTRKYRGYFIKKDYGYVYSKRNTLAILGSWENTRCEANWTGMNDVPDDACSSLAVSNYIHLHRKGCKVVFPEHKTYHVYGRIDCTGYSVDFNHSSMVSIDFESVEEKALPLPVGATPASLRSIYGLVFFESDDAVLENLVIDGRASARAEEPMLGSECLIAMGKNRRATLKNIVLKDAVDCGICTYAIERCRFENLLFEKCGEHGFYTHCYRENIRFNHCEFVDCGQSSTIYKQRGQSACVRFAGMRDRKAEELQTLKAFFEDCIFTANGPYSVATMYSDLPYAEFHRCVWRGVGGYTVASAELAEKTGKLVEYRFYECINPCSKINSVNTVRRLYNCREVRNPFSDAAELTDCEIIASYADVENQYSASFTNELAQPIVFRNCSFKKDSSDISVRNTITDARSLVFEKCSWNFNAASSDRNRGTYYLVLNSDDSVNGQAREIHFKDCSISLDQYRLLLSSDAVIEFDDCLFVSAYKPFVETKAEHPSRVRKASFRNTEEVPFAGRFVLFSTD